MMIAESIIAAFVYVSSVVVTLRAGSRALYLLTHDGKIGVMEGPLICGPTDIDKKSSKSNFTEISPLWESTFGFRQAVEISLQPQQKKPQPHLTYYHRTSSEKNDIVKIPIEVDSDHIIPTTKNQVNIIQNNNDENNENNHIGKKILLRLQKQTKEGMELINWWLKESKKFLPFRNKNDNYLVDNEDDDLDYDLAVGATVPIPSITTTKQPVTAYSDTNNNEIISSIPPIPKTAHVKAYAPGVFSKLRNRFGVSDREFTKSFLESGPYISFQSNSKGAARAGGFFFFTRDGAYMVKTIKKAEIDTFFEMLPKYYKYMKRNARRSLLTKFFGIYSVQVKEEERYLSEFWGYKKESNEDEHYFVIMNAVFPAEGAKFISERFDLKGSTVGRDCSLEEREKKGSNAVLKDLDLIQQSKSEYDVEARPITPRMTQCGINIGAKQKSELLLQIRKDVELLMECNVMDYSLLVGVVDLDYFDSPLFNNQINDEDIYCRRQRSHFWIPKVNTKIAKLLSPLRLLMAPPMYICTRIHAVVDRTISSVLTLPLPYYGAGICGVDGGALSVIRGRKQGRRSTFYLGIIDFLQPWTTRKVLEKELKGLIGYDTKAISCVDPKVYAQRFINFLDTNIC